MGLESIYLAVQILMLVRKIMKAAKTLNIEVLNHIIGSISITVKSITTF
jgi:hypothetical protein